MYDADKIQAFRKNPNKPAVVKPFHMWWAQVIDLNGELVTDLFPTQQAALKKAHEYAHMIHKQRLIAALGSQIAKTHEAC